MDTKTSVTRLVHCPDGLSRTVTMQYWYWRHFDSLCRQKKMIYEDVIDYQWFLAEAFAEAFDRDVEIEFRYSLAWRIFAEIRDRYPGTVVLADNDNAPPVPDAGTADAGLACAGATPEIDWSLSIKMRCGERIRCGRPVVEQNDSRASARKNVVQAGHLHLSVRKHGVRLRRSGPKTG